MKTEYSTSTVPLRSLKYQAVPVARMLKLMPPCSPCDFLECAWDVVISSLLKGQIHQWIHFYPAESGMAFTELSANLFACSALKIF
jgi:hypothetical protein